MQRTFFDGRPIAQTCPLTAERPAYVANSQTSKQAADTIAPHTGQLREAVYRFFLKRGEEGATDQEVSACLAMLQDTARARRVELRNSGHVQDSGKRRATASRCTAKVWTATGKPYPGE
jgi:hypothetical protein